MLNSARVALETSVLAQGLPFPANRTLAAALQKTIREASAEPCTTACLNGTLRADLSDEEIQLFCPESPDASIQKVTLATLPAVLATGSAGATTVATTMLAAHRQGIEVVATGGIGGVHIRSNVQDPIDESGDLQALARIPVTVVCSGPKAILDVAATRERLETCGVTVIGFGTDTMPAFYCGQSPHAVDVRCNTAREVAEVIRQRNALGLPSAVLVTVPVPDEHALPWDEVQKIVRNAMRTHEAAHLAPRDMTPFLLRAVRDKLGQRALDANIALLLHNARVASDIAVALSSSRAC